MLLCCGHLECFTIKVWLLEDGALVPALLTCLSLAGPMNRELALRAASQAGSKALAQAGQPIGAYPGNPGASLQNTGWDLEKSSVGSRDPAGDLLP